MIKYGLDWIDKTWISKTWIHDQISIFLGFMGTEYDKHVLGTNVPVQ